MRRALRIIGLVAAGSIGWFLGDAAEYAIEARVAAGDPFWLSTLLPLSVSAIGSFCVGLQIGRWVWK